jgi:hypothetical protein
MRNPKYKRTLLDFFVGLLGDERYPGPAVWQKFLRPGSCWLIMRRLD